MRRLNFPCPEYLVNAAPRNCLHFGSAGIIYLVADVRAWDTATGKSIRNWHNGPHEYYSLDDLDAFALDGRSYAMSVGCKPPLRVIDADTAAARATLGVDGVTALALSADGRLLARVRSRAKWWSRTCFTARQWLNCPAMARRLRSSVFRWTDTCWHRRRMRKRAGVAGQRRRHGGHQAAR